MLDNLGNCILSYGDAVLSTSSPVLLSTLAPGKVSSWPSFHLLTAVCHFVDTELDSRCQDISPMLRPIGYVKRFNGETIPEPALQQFSFFSPILFPLWDLTFINRQERHICVSLHRYIIKPHRSYFEQPHWFVYSIFCLNSLVIQWTKLVQWNYYISTWLIFTIWEDSKYFAI